MITKRIIPCLDIKDGQTVKGVHFENLAQAGDPVSLAEKYYNDGADELVFLDITATNDKRKTILDVVEAVASKVFIPLTVGGGVRSIEDIHNLLLAGADKVSLNTAAVINPQLIYDGAKTFGSQCITIAVDVKKTDGIYYVVTNAGTKRTDYTVTEWVKKITDLGAGEILLTSMDTDGTKSGYDLEVTQLVSDMTNLPVIASGGAGANVKHFTDIFQKGHADAALAASIFHFNELPIPELKSQLKQAGVNIR